MVRLPFGLAQGERSPPVPKQNGFAPILILIVVIAIVAACGLMYIKYSQDRSKTTSQNTQPPKTFQIPFVQKTNPYLGTPCQSNPSLNFPHDLTDSSLLAKITPPSLIASKVQDRAWLWIDQSKASKIPIYAPVDADLVRGIYKSKVNEGRETTDYDFHFQVSCEVWFFINHVSEPIDKIKKLFPNTPVTSGNTAENFTQIAPPIHFSAGDIIGYTVGTALAHSFDFAVFDLNIQNKLVGELKTNDTRFYNFICPFDVFPKDIKSSYYQRLIPDLIPESNCHSKK